LRPAEQRARARLHRDEGDRCDGRLGGLLAAQHARDDSGGAAHLVQHHPGLGALGGHGDQDGLVVGRDEEDGAVVALDVDLRQLAAAEALSSPLAEREQGGAHRGHPVLVHRRGQRGGHRQAVEGHDGRGLELRRLHEQVPDRPVQARRSAAGRDLAVQVGHADSFGTGGRRLPLESHRPRPAGA
jgi:hypothetical protein